MIFKGNHFCKIKIVTLRCNRCKCKVKEKEDMKKSKLELLLDYIPRIVFAIGLVVSMIILSCDVRRVPFEVLSNKIDVASKKCEQVTDKLDKVIKSIDCELCCYGITNTNLVSNCVSNRCCHVIKKCGERDCN